MKFLDQARVYIRSGDGGAGSISFRREKFIEFGGPDGGDGGRGGDVVVECADGLNTLIDFRYQQHFKAKTGMHGMGRNRAGGRGADAVLKVPVGTQVFDEESGAMLADLTEPGERVVVAKGGNGGFGNAHFTTSTNRAPRRANPGLPGIERTLILRLKLIADAGLIGLPNAGKSTFLAAVSAAKPKIADYPFTTLHPGLGVVRIDGRDFVLADIPGLIEGAHEGHGLGDRFLGHVERCGALVHLVDATGANAGADYRTIRRELAAYGAGLAEKAEIVALSKVDAVDEETLKKQTERLKRAIRSFGPPLAPGAKRAKPLMLSTATRTGVTEVCARRWRRSRRGARGGRREGQPGRMGAVDLEALVPTLTEEASGPPLHGRGPGARVHAPGASQWPLSLAHRRRERAPSIVELARLFRQHDRHAVPDRIGEPRGARNELLPNRIVGELRSRHRAYQDLQETGVDFRAARRLVCRRALVRIIAHGRLPHPAGYCRALPKREKGRRQADPKSTQNRKAAT